MSRPAILGSSAALLAMAHRFGHPSIFHALDEPMSRRRRDWIPDESRVIVVASGQVAHKQAHAAKAYNCQNRRPFKPSKWIAFYANGQIDSFAEIVGVPEDDVVLGSHPEFARLAAEAMIGPYQLRTLIRLTDVRSVGPIVNDKQDKHGHKTAWTQSHRYTTIEKLRKAKKTSELDVKYVRTRAPRQDGQRTSPPPVVGLRRKGRS